MNHIPFPKVYYGGDYNPDQWPEAIWHEDMRLFEEAHVNMVTLPAFSWARLQPSEHVYDFSWLDSILALLTSSRIDVCLATSTAAQPAWMSLRYPDILPVDSDGRRRKHGGRVNFCPNSPTYREFSGKLVRAMAERYKDYAGLAMWHIANEYGTYCYCDTCAAAFRGWAKARHGSIEEVNRAWNLSFWGHTIYSWDEIVPPSNLNGDNYCFQGMAVDYNRFMSDSSLGCYLNEHAILKEITPDIPVTTNLMGTFKPLDYFRWAEHMDVVSWDSYPSARTSPSQTALRHDLMRGLKGGQPFMLMEQTPSQQNWQDYCSLKRPGIMRLWSYQAVAHGADTVMFFQMRRSQGACEKYHGALIAHAGHGDTRVFRECAELGRELEALGAAFIGSRIEAQVAIVFDWENWWAVEASSGPTKDKSYAQQVARFYKSFHDRNVAVDFVKPGDDLTEYKLVLAPMLYMLKPGMAQNLETYVYGGGTFVTTFFSGIVDENDLVALGGYPAELRRLLGIWVEEIDSLHPDMKNTLAMATPMGDLRGEYECGLLCDILHLEGARAMATYQRDFYAGMPALTVNRFGAGNAYYVATHGEERFVADLAAHLCTELGLVPPLVAPEGVEVTRRALPEAEFLFVLNHNAEAVAMGMPPAPGEWTDMLGAPSGERLTLPAYGVAILRRAL